ncbi:MAG: SCP2 sterol-binding domain-containing protein [Thermoanaerobaculum sp.]|nr:SCP2 sterol-binding domain-containing protein [Thermoanaerobaculum sp.]MDW7967622.1 SCP2 sterol-binding domain-containing protein [Thermoanaerobaculum sp.]
MDLAKLFSPEGAEVLRHALTASPSWAQQAAGWTTTLALVAEGEGSSQALWLALERGECVQLRPVGDQEVQQAEFVLQGSFSVWRAILAGQLDPVGAVFTGKLKVARGNVMALSARIGAARALLEAARQAVERQA